MNRAELIQAASDASGESRRATESVLNAALAVITRELGSGGSVEIRGFGKFEPVAIAERQGRNPRTGAVITLPASTKPRFRAARALKDELSAA